MTARAVRLTNVDIDNALANAHLETVFQPIVSLSDRHILRHEVFVRWEHPGLGNLPPGAFITFFENQGRMGELTRYVLEQALRTYQPGGAIAHGGLSLNLAPSDLADEKLPDDIAALLSTYDVAPGELTLECPPFAPDVPHNDQRKRYQALAETGCPVALEIRLRTSEATNLLDPFPFGEIKAGGSSILRYARTARGGPGMSSLSELLAFAGDKGARMTAVGIEEAGAAEALATLGFQAGQGNALARTGHLRTTRTLTQRIANSPKTAPSALAEKAHAEEAQSGEEKTPDTENESADTQRKARIAAAKRTALRRFHAARNAQQTARPGPAPVPVEEENDGASEAVATARKLQRHLEESLGDRTLADGTLPVLEPVALTSIELGIGVTAGFSNGLRLDGYDSPVGSVGPDGMKAQTAGAINPLVSFAPVQNPAEKPDPRTIDELLNALPSDFVMRAQAAQAEAAEAPSPADMDEMAEDLTSEADELDGVVAQLPEIEETSEAEDVDAEAIAVASAEFSLRDDHDAVNADAAGLEQTEELQGDLSTHDLVATPSSYDEDEPSFFATVGATTLRVLRRKYRITHFWPRSFKRAWHRYQASRQESLYES